MNVEPQKICGAFFNIGNSKWAIDVLFKEPSFKNDQQFYTVVDIYNVDHLYEDNSDFKLRAGFLMFIQDSNQKYIEAPQSDSYCQGRLFEAKARISHACLNENKERILQDGTLKLMFKVFVEDEDWSGQ